uniref:ShKT domain-containing protein n=1 Tax=Parastrongyloides trichosuri TaxID=131310 RepID=A0A0N5A396_PARTI
MNILIIFIGTTLILSNTISSTCSDTISCCNEIKQFCHNNEYLSFMKNHCPRTCCMCFFNNNYQNESINQKDNLYQEECFGNQKNETKPLIGNGAVPNGYKRQNNYPVGSGVSV